MNKISVFDLFGKDKLVEKKIKGTAAKVLRELKKENLAVEIFIIGKAMARAINKKFRGKDKAADVLSFIEPEDFFSPPSKFRKIGEIYLNAQISNSKSQIQNLLIHGLFHLLGYTHKKKNDRIKMEKMENKLKCILRP